jgi:hypothetical protein
VRSEPGYDSMDLVVDLVVTPSYDWHWKDEADFETAIRRGIVYGRQRRLVELEAERVVHLIEERDGPFGQVVGFHLARSHARPRHGTRRSHGWFGGAALELLDCTGRRLSHSLLVSCHRG